MGINPTTVSQQTLNLAGGSASYTTTKPVDLTQVSVAGATGATQVVVTVDGVQKATITLDANKNGSVGTTAVAGASAETSAKTGTAQSGRYGNPAASPLGYQGQNNQTNVGSGNYIGPEAPNQAPVADNIPSGKVISLTATGATAGTATLTLDTAGAQVGVNNNPNTDSSY